MTYLPKLVAESNLPKDYRDYLAALSKTRFSGDIDITYGGRLVAATDNSVYQQLPQGVIYPRHSDDLQLLLQLASEPAFQQISFSPRGGGTGTNGQSLTPGLVVDMSRHMNQVLEVNIEQGWVSVQGGVVKDQLNDELRLHGYFFSPDLSTSNRATLGGMINTDASGQGSLVYGKTSDHVLGLSTVLIGGERLDSKPVPLQQAKALSEQEGTVGAIYRQAIDTCVDCRADIEQKFPPLNRFLTGYDLKHTYDPEHQTLDLSRLIAGSEGTLGFVAEARLNITPIPNYRTLVNVKYSDFQAALNNAPFLVDARATSVETIDSKVLNLAREDIIWHSVQPLLTDVEGQTMNGINMVEFASTEASENKTKVEQLCQRLDALIKAKDNQGVIGYQICDDLDSIQTIYAMRKKSVGLLGATKGRRKPVAFAEDTAVPPEKLAEFIIEFRQILDNAGLQYGMFGHADAGVLHVRPALDLTEPDDEQLLREISDKVAALTSRYGGLMWGEHGKGYRSEYAPEFFGEQLFTELRKLKTAVDPRNQLNPGKICTPLQGNHSLVSVDARKRGYYDRQIPVHVRDSYRNAMDCNGNGLCFNYDTKAVMCPSFKVSGDRRFSPKGRSSLMREWLRLNSQQGFDASQPPQQRASALKRWLNSWRNSDDFSHQVKHSMDKCLACKACTNQCPVSVDVPTFRARFLQHYYSRYARPPKDWLVKNVEQTASLGAKIPKLANALTHNSATKALLTHVVGYVDTPSFSVPNLISRWQQQGFAIMDSQQILACDARQRDNFVVIVQDPFTSFYEAQVVESFAAVAHRLGYQPVLLPFIGHGKALHVKGYLDEFRQTAERVAAQLIPLTQQGVELVGVDTSTALIFRDEYQQILAEDAEKLLVKTVIEWFDDKPLPAIEQPNHRTYGLLLHCTEQSFMPESAEHWQTLFASLGLQLDILKVGCCGMAGTYGHERSHQQDSKALYEMGWRQAVNSYGNGGLVATGFSCRSQIQRMEKKRVRHPLEVILKCFD
ncbi:MAG: D-2-hydroxyglutarate dehydrogenase YdiJ [Pseudomonadota bacterium]